MALTKIAIAGGGLSGSLAALALARRPDVELVLLEQADRFGGNHIWSMFDSDVPPAVRWLTEFLHFDRWSDHEVRFPLRQRRIAIGYSSLRSSDLDLAVRTSLDERQYCLGARIESLTARSVKLGNGKEITADVVIDARGGSLPKGPELGWQKFVGQRFTFASPHGVERPVIMDATVRQEDGFRFLYLLPFSATELFIEDTYYSSSDALDEAAVAAGIYKFARALTLSEPIQLGSEVGRLPVVIEACLNDIWPQHDEVPRLGVRGGFFHPTTSYSLPDALLNASLLASAPKLGQRSVHDLLRGRAERIWRERAFFQFLNRMLFRAADADQRHKVLGHFYRLPEAVIARFYAAQLTRLDKVRILSGRPPVPLFKALTSLGRRVAT